MLIPVVARLRRGSAAARFLVLCVRIPPGEWIFVSLQCSVFRGLCNVLITRSEESYWIWCVAMCDRGASIMRRPWPALGRSATGGKKSRFRIFLYYT